MMRPPDADVASEAPGSRRTSALLRWLPLLIGLVAFELTADPMLGVALACLRFGERDFSTALWLRRVDPVPARGRAVAWFLFAWGAAKVALAGLVSMIALAVIAAFGQLAGAGAAVLIGQANGGIFTSLGAGLCFLAGTWVATAFACMGGVRVWIGRSLHDARRSGEWPPRAGEAEVRRGNPLLAAVAFAWIVTLLTLMLLFVIALPAHLRHDQGILVAASVILIAALLAGLWVLTVFQRRIAASHPEECWPSDE